MALEDSIKALFDTCHQKSLTIVTAESCTGGLIGAALTSVPGSSSVYERGFITYSNNAKTELLQVPIAIVEREGAVSDPVARAMADGALMATRADVAVSVTGIAGPGGGTDGKPVGLVFIAVSSREHETLCREYHFKGDRNAVRTQAVEAAIDMLQVRVDTIGTAV